MLISQENLIEDLLNPDEWDFRDVTEPWELPYAVIYEYARSSVYREALTEWFQQPSGARLSRLVITEYPDVLRACGFRRKLPDKLTVGEVFERIYDHADNERSMRTALYLLNSDTPRVFHQQKLLCMALRFPQFPKPWVQVRRMKGVEYLKKRCFNWPSGLPPLIELWDETDLSQDPLYAVRASSRPANIEQHTFEIDWMASAHTIKQSFSKWLSRHHPYGRGKPTVSEPLNWLGAYRIMSLTKLSSSQACSAAKEYLARNKRSTSFGCYPNYQTVNKWTEAVAKAHSLLEGCFAEELSKRAKLLWLV